MWLYNVITPCVTYGERALEAQPIVVPIQPNNTELWGVGRESCITYSNLAEILLKIVTNNEYNVS